MNYDNYYYEGASADSKIGSSSQDMLEGLRTQRTLPIRRVFSRIGAGIAIFAALYVLGANIFVILMNTFGLADHVSGNVSRMFLSAFTIYVIALPVLLLSLKGVEAEKPEQKKFGFWKFLLTLCVCLGITYIGALIGNAVMSLISLIVGHDYSNSLNSVVFGDDLLKSSLYTIIMAPIGEEFVYRKLVIDRTKRYGALPSILVSGILFGLMHGNFYQLFYTVALGMIFAYVYYNYGKIHICIFLHMAVNFMGSIIPSIMITDLTSISMDGFDAWMLVQLLVTIVHGLAIYAYMAFAIIFMIIFLRKMKNRPAEIDIPRKKTFSTVFLNPGMICCFVVFAAYFVLALIPI